MCMLAQEAYVKSSFKDSMKHYRVGGGRWFILCPVKKPPDDSCDGSARFV